MKTVEMMLQLGKVCILIHVKKFLLQQQTTICFIHSLSRSAFLPTLK